MSGKLEYRPEVDGLRAIAVLAVILFHAGIPAASGGYVGVDVFFVISGYLITSLILLEQAAGNFSLLHFYERRARRILPALLFVVLASLPLAWLWLAPRDLADYGLCLAAVAGFNSNFLFWSEAGYWDTASELKPLLHTWSLAIEEQFYLLFPLLLIALKRFRRPIAFATVLVLSVTSLAIAHWLARHAPAAGFYLLPSRFWELAIGALIAFISLHRPALIQALRQHRRSMELAGLTGLALIGYAIVNFDNRTPFPGLHALIPTLGTALLLVATHQGSTIGRLLSARLLVGIGLVSYSAYLWHYLLFALARHRLLETPATSTFLLLGLVSLGLAFVSWKIVEQPFRNRARFRRRTIFALSAAGLLTLAIIGLVTWSAKGFPARAGMDHLAAEALEKALMINPGLDAKCEGNAPDEPACRTSDTPEILVWGDSYAMHLVDGILASNRQAGIIQLTLSVCGPMFDIAPTFEPDYGPDWAQECIAFNDEVRTFLAANPSVRHVVLSSAFIQYLIADLIDREGEKTEPSPERALALFNATLDELEHMGITPVVFSPAPQNDNDLGRCVVKAQWQGIDPDTCDFDLDQASESFVASKTFLQQIAQRHRVIFLDELLCPDGHCRTHEGSIAIYRDVAHLSRAGSAAVGSRFDFYGLITRQP